MASIEIFFQFPSLGCIYIEKYSNARLIFAGPNCI
jgi:hypothetical protein